MQQADWLAIYLLASCTSEQLYEQLFFFSSKYFLGSSKLEDIQVTGYEIMFGSSEMNI